MTTTESEPDVADAEASAVTTTEAEVFDLDMPVRLHELTYLDEGEEVTVGRSDIDSYCVLPADGAALLRELEAGRTPRDAQVWFEATYGIGVDIADFLGAMRELELLLVVDEVAPEVAPVKWQRFGRACFSRPAMIGYAVLIAVAVALMVRDTRLVPHYSNLFFTDYVTVLELTLFLGQLPLILFHESAHALAGRRLGLRSSLSLGRRLYFIVFQTSLDGLVTVPRRQRYLPLLAGLLADLVVIAVFTMVGAVSAGPDGIPWWGGLFLALAFTTLLRAIWQFYFYLETDIYQVVVTVLGCNNLQAVTRRLIANRWWRLLRRPERAKDESRWHPRDLAVGRWYMWLVLVGYGVAIATLVWAAVPATFTFLGLVADKIFTDGADWSQLVDGWLFVLLNLVQAGIVIGLMIRERRRRKTKPTYSHVID